MQKEEVDLLMGEMIPMNNIIPGDVKQKPDKIETYAGKQTARVTKIFKKEDGSQYKFTRKINKDGSITDKIEHKHN